jgi:hypothetical protein
MNYIFSKFLNYDINNINYNKNNKIDNNNNMNFNKNNKIDNNNNNNFNKNNKIYNTNNNFFNITHHNNKNIYKPK